MTPPKLDIKNKKFTYNKLRKKILNYYGDNQVDNLYLDSLKVYDVPKESRIYKQEGNKYKFLNIDIGENHMISRCVFVAKE
jgi:hypothetical protein